MSFPRFEPLLTEDRVREIIREDNAEAAELFGDPRGQQLIIDAKNAEMRWERETAIKLSVLTGDHSFYPLLTVCKFFYSLSQISKAISKVAVVVILRGVSRHAKSVLRVADLAHDASPSLFERDNGSVGEPARASEEAGPGRADGGAR